MMNNKTYPIFFLLVCMLMVACGETAEKGGVTKEEAKTQKSSGSNTDFCELYGWYGDGTCDDFCEQEDPDCGGVTCDALPVCPEGTIESECNPELDEGCVVTEEVCGTTLTCESAAQCLALPVCEPGFEEVEACVPDSNCYSDTLCGTTINCQEIIAVCDAALYCPEGMVWVESCEPSTSCIEMNGGCAGSWFCERAEACEAFPTCPEGTKNVEVCDLNEPTCELATICGYAIYCESERD